jgi:citrate synthase
MDGNVAPTGITTELASHDLHHIWVRGVDLTEEAMGHLTFGGMVFLLLRGRMPTANELRMIDAVLVSLVEHGLTPSAVMARMTYSLAPESLQGAVSAGLLSVGGVLLGSMEDCSRILERVEAEMQGGQSRSAAIEGIAKEYRAAGKKLPGVGHAIHREGDPRTARLTVIARECGLRGDHLETLSEMARIAGRNGKPLPVNVTGAVAAILLELGIPWRLQRGFALIARTAGLVAHIGEEQEHPITPAVRELTRGNHGKA